MELDFGAFKKEETVTPKSATPKAPHMDWKKKYEDLEELMNQSNREFNKALEIGKKAYDELQTAFALSNENNSELQGEITMFRLQEEQMKKAIDILSKQAEKFKFRPHQYSQIAQILTYMRLHGTKAALQRVKEMVGTTEISAVRKWIFDLLEAPYE